jgi:large subunit ribosomal protein L28e
MIWRKEEMTVDIGLSSTIAFPLFSAFTILLNASFSILLPIPLDLVKHG